MEIVEFNLTDSRLMDEFNSIMPMLYTNEAFIKKQNTLSEYNFVSAYIAKEENKVMARLACYNFQENDNEKIYFFGNFEALTVEAGKRILHHLKNKLTLTHKQVKLIGPINGSTWSNYRIALNHSSLLFPNDLVNPHYYNDILITSDFKELHHYVTNLQTDFNLKLYTPNKEFEIVFFSKDELLSRIEEIYQLTMQSFKLAPFFIPIPFSVFEQQFIKQLNQIDLELSPFALNTKKELCAYSSCYLNFEKDTIVVKTIARKLGREYAGLGRYLSDAITQNALNKGYKKILHAFMHIQNSSKSLSEKYNGITLKNYTLFQCEL